MEHLAKSAPECRVERAFGIQSEMELAFAGVHQLCATMLDEAGELPDPQREALETALGVSAGPAPDRFLVSLAVLNLFSAIAEARPFLGLIDDAQWMDRASTQVLTFVARRLLAEPVGLVFAVRNPPDEFSGLPQREVGRLSDSDARALLTSVMPGRLDPGVQDRIIAETRGNPLAILELSHEFTVADLAGGFGRLILDHSRNGWKRASASGLKHCLGTPTDSCSLLPPNPRATCPCCGGQPRKWTSTLRLRPQRSLPDCLR